MLEYNCKKNFDNAPLEEKPLLISGQKSWKRIPHLKQWHETSGKRYPESFPTTIKRERKPKSPARLTDVEWQKWPTKS